MADIQNDMMVSLVYTLRLSDDQVVDSSDGREPLQYIHGHGQLIAGLERELAGMTTGDEKDVVVAPEDAYGEDDPDLVDVLPRSAFPSQVAVGEAYHMQTESGESVLVYIEDVGDEQVHVNLNHPLAGETLHFHVKVAGVREASEEEIAASLSSCCGGSCAQGCASCGEQACDCAEGTCACGD